ncbi:protein FAM76B-like [Sycon ciliatum]|uniref:protein FAM76B-like n=1 Tax=Sycon ciliatum TaxID=27933 RepID=UPI0020AB3280|eukprot:scpid41806/ scgid9938/ Protein FAM76B
MSKAVYACLKCRKQVKSFEELSSSQQLCKPCRSKYPVLTCKFCRSDFHYMEKSPIGDKDPVCNKCTEYLQRFGKPRVCGYCNLLAAFKGDLCHRCQASQKKYGDPISCQQCQVKCAFPKSRESRQKVGDQVLCFVCTVAYKKAQHRSVKRKPDGQGYRTEPSGVPIVTTVQVASGTTTITASVASVEPAHKLADSPLLASSSNTLVPPPKKRKFSSNGSGALPSPVASVAPSSLFSGGVPMTSGQASSAGTISTRGGLDTSRAPMAFTQLVDDPMSSFEMVNNLTEKVASLQKQVKERDQQLLEKDKKATEFKAEVRDTEKSLRTKIMQLQKQLETTQTDCYSLRRQVGQLTSSTSANKSARGRAKDGASRLQKVERDGRLFASQHVKREQPVEVKEEVAAEPQQVEAEKESPEPDSVSPTETTKVEDEANSSSDEDAPTN